MKRIKRVRFVQKSWRHWSQWITVGTREQCCDCGMVHSVQYGLKRRGDKFTVWKRVRVHHTATKAIRKVRNFKCR